MIFIRRLSILFAISLLFSCKSDTQLKKQVWRTKVWVKEHQKHNQLLDHEKHEGWTLLFNGENLDGWHLYNNPDSTRFSAWEVREGLLFCNATNTKRAFGDLITDKTYENYELVFEWRMAFRGNGGVFINVQESPKYEATFHTGPEYQLLDPNHSDTNTPLKRAGCLWGISPQQHPAIVNPTNEWNRARIVQKDGKIEFYLNGKRTAQEDFNSPDWQKRLAASRFKDAPSFGMASRGKIALQNWYFNSWFRNMKIREL